MNFLELATNRFSVRSYRPDPIDEETMQYILQAGRVAPTACNNQPQRVYVVRSEEMRKKLAKASPCTFDAPVILVIAYDETLCWKNRRMMGKPSGETDAAIVTTHMMLAAQNEGVGSCWVMHFDPAAMREHFHIPSHIEPLALLVMGYPAEDAKPLDLHFSKRPMCETVVYEDFSSDLG